MSKYLDKNNLIHLIEKIKEKFVRKEEGKGLSKNDFTDELKTKLESINTNAEIETYTLVWGSAAKPMNWESKRKILEVKNGFGKIHLDFKGTGEGGVIANLPSNAPTPTALLEIQVGGANGQTVWIDAGHRDVRTGGSGFENNARVILDLWGYFE